MKHLIKKIVLFSLGLFLLIWIISYAKCEILTFSYSNDFENIVINDVTLGNNLKILKYTDEYAKVYYMGEKYDLVTFSKRKGEWEISSHRIVKTQNDKFVRLFVWPFFWHYLIA